MKITYLGTAASEGLPAPFCTCEVCRRAREAGGKSVRTRSQALVDESLLIDFPPDTYLHWLRTPFDFLKVTDLLVTHSHMDHWYPDDVQSVVPPYGHHDPSYTLTLHGNERVIQMLEEGMAREEPQILETVPRKVAKAFETFAAGDYQVTPLPADHCYTEKALFYLIEKGDKALLYAHDTGYFLDPVWEYLASRKDLRLGLVSLDCTHGWDENRQNHMGFTVDARSGTGWWSWAGRTGTPCSCATTSPTTGAAPTRNRPPGPRAGPAGQLRRPDPGILIPLLLKAAWTTGRLFAASIVTKAGAGVLTIPPRRGRLWERERGEAP